VGKQGDESVQRHYSEEEYESKQGDVSVQTGDSE